VLLLIWPSVGLTHLGWLHKVRKSLIFAGKRPKFAPGFRPFQTGSSLMQPVWLGVRTVPLTIGSSKQSRQYSVGPVVTGRRRL